MRIHANQYRGLMNLDLLFSLLPIVLISLLALQLYSSFRLHAISNVDDRITREKLGSVGEFLVKSRLAISQKDLRILNLIDSGSFDDSLLSELQSRSDLTRLSVAFDERGSGNNCVSRLAVSKPDYKVVLLSVCGD
ncbi:hypothetical protein HY990_03025 [Candidatus Micrarchaeota archaeon]|nr:hypothetical protein [Candidatus Micrarchaeota archaeon]